MARGQHCAPGTIGAGRQTRTRTKKRAYGPLVRSSTRGASAGSSLAWGLQRIADEKKPRYRGHLAWGLKPDVPSSTLVSQPTDDSPIVSETQNQNLRAGSNNTASGGRGDAGLEELTAWARSRTRALLGPMQNASIEVRFDLRGKTAGQVRIPARGRYLIRYNLELLKRGGIDFIERTIPHEVAHVLAYHRHGPKIRPHGREWKGIMRQLGAEPTRCHHYDVSGLGARRLRHFQYHCSCMEHQLSSIRHNKVAKGQRYLCRRCGEPLRPGRLGAIPKAAF